MGEFLKAKTKRFNSNTFLFIITIVLFIAMYVAGMIVFADKGFAKPQMFTNLFINNAGLIVIGCGMTIVMITGALMLLLRFRLVLDYCLVCFKAI